MDDRKNYPLRISDELKEKSTYIAEYYGRSLNKQIEQLLKRMVRSFESKHGEIILPDQKS